MNSMELRFFRTGPKSWILLNENGGRRGENSFQNSLRQYKYTVMALLLFKI